MLRPSLKMARANRRHLSIVLSKSLGLCLFATAFVAAPFAQGAEVFLRNLNVNEYHQSARVTVELSEAAQAPVKVNFATGLGSATQGRDYYGTYSVVEFNVGDLKQFVRFEVLNDTEIEPDETIPVRIWGAEGATLGRDVATVTIIDDDSGGTDTPVISIKPVTVAENIGQAVVSIELSVTAPRAVSLMFATSGISAKAGADFYGSSETLRFAPGETSKTATVTILDDELVEGNETIKTRIFNVVGAALGQNESTITITDDDSPDPDANSLDVHVLNRLGYGPGRWHRDRIEAIGVDNYIEEQLNPDSLPADSRRCDGCVDGKIFRAINNYRQLEEVLVDFWFNHFNVDDETAIARLDMPRYERDAIRKHIFGKFEDMLDAVAKSPAMLRYLDNRSSTRADYVDSRGRLRGLNENYSRELMELHTLGVDGGYDDDDVIEVARILTGWTSRRNTETNRHYFYYSKNYHDKGKKDVMNEAFVVPSDQGQQEGENLLKFLANQPSTAKFVSSKLIKRFVIETPPEGLVDAAAEAWTSSGGNLRDVMRVILRSGHFVNQNNFGTKIKSPHHLIASATRAMDYYTVPDDLMEKLKTMLTEQGQSLYKVAPPTGVPEDSRFWVSGAAMLARFDSMLILAGDDRLRNGIEASDGSPEALVSQIAAQVLSHGVSQATRDTIIEYVKSLPSDATLERRKTDVLALLLSSPEFMRH